MNPPALFIFAGVGLLLARVARAARPRTHATPPARPVTFRDVLAALATRERAYKWQRN